MRNQTPPAVLIQLADPPLVTSDLVGLLLILHFGTGHKHQHQHRHRAQKVSTGLTRLYRGLYSAVVHFPGLNHSSRFFVGQPLITSGLVM